MYTYNYFITRVIDGDTVEGNVDLGFGISKKMRVRLAEVDTPEIFRPKSDAERKLGYKAKEFVEDLALNRNIVLKTEKDKTGKYGRYIGHLYTSEGENINKLLIENRLTKNDVQM